MKFNFDAIDETDILEETIKPRVESLGGTLEKVTLSGNHITPCIQVKFPCILLLYQTYVHHSKVFLIVGIYFLELLRSEL